MMEDAVKWTSVKEALPEEFRAVLVYRTNKYGEKIVDAGYYEGGGKWKTMGFPTKSVSHWMLMPEPPKEGV